MRIVDMHTHIASQYADLAVQWMDQCQIDSVVTLGWADAFGERLRRDAEIFGLYPGRFIVFSNVDWSGVNEEDFGRAAAKQLEEDVAAGARGLKIFKSLGLEIRRRNGELWQVDDPAFDAIWAKAGELGIPVLMHVADPSAFWQPLTERNFWNAVLQGEWEGWSYYRQKHPGHEELLGERNEVIARHPDTTFICPHVGSRADCLDSAADDLDAFPNLYYDMSARIPMLGLPGRRAAHSREFLIEYQDRISFGTDIIYQQAYVTTGIQMQCLHQPGSIPLGNASPEERYTQTTVEFFRSNVDFLTTDRVQADPPFNRNRRGFPIAGMALPRHACDKILYQNARRLTGTK